MAPRPTAPRRNQQSSQNEHVYELGVRGRKTGVTLEDTGERDEYGMEPVDRLFSSPDKERPQGLSSDDEQAMDIDEASPNGPATVSRLRKERLSIPRARSPAKTFLNSPARQNPHIARNSSPLRGSIIGDQSANTAKAPSRRLDLGANSQKGPTAPGTSKVNGATSQNASQNGRRNGHAAEDSSDEAVIRGSKRKSPEPEEEEEDEEAMDVLDAGADYDPQPQEEYEAEYEEPDEEQEQEEEAVAPVEEVQPKKRGRKPKPREPEEEAAPEQEPQQPEEPEEPEDVEEEPVKKKRGRPAKNSPVREPAKVAQPTQKRKPGRPSLNKNKPVVDSEPEPVEDRGAKRQKTEASSKTSKAAQTPAVKGKPGRKRKSSGVGAESPAVIPRPPMPKKRGLQILRRNDLEVKTTRSGRISTKPLEFWRGEHYEFDPEDDKVIEDKGGRRIKVGTAIKNVVRVDYEDAAPQKKRGRGKSTAGRPKRRVSEEDVDDEYREEWEDAPGRVTGEIVVWDPYFEENPPDSHEQVEVAELDVAVSEAAIHMKDIKDATWKFAKTLTMPFFGTGIVDLPPHSAKLPKNARKMHMAFFVHYGSVSVTVARNEFRITKGGQFFVPRGNTYQIVNDTDRPARLFFSQGCEVNPPPQSQEL